MTKNKTDFCGGNAVSDPVSNQWEEQEWTEIKRHSRRVTFWNNVVDYLFIGAAFLLFFGFFGCKAIEIIKGENGMLFLFLLGAALILTGMISAIRGKNGRT